MTYIEELGAKAKAAETAAAVASTMQKNAALRAIADALTENSAAIIEENKKDVAAAADHGISKVMTDRLMLDEKRIKGIADGVLSVIKLEDPVGNVISGSVRPNGMKIQKVRVPIGTIGIIFESRPNVTVDAAVLCLKSGNTCILRGGKDAYHSNRILCEVMRNAVKSAGLPEDVIQFVDDTTREVTTQLMKCSKYLDLLIPRGGAGLIRAVKENASVPIIETGTGNCHVYVDESADPEMAVNIVDNGKTQRPSVCNAIERLADEISEVVRERLI